MERNRGLSLLLVVCGVALVAVLGMEVPAEAVEEPPPEAVVEMVALRYYPPRLEIATGTVVVFDNREPLDYPLIGGGHEILSEYYGGFESPNIAPGTRWRHRFDQPGAYRYRCKRHPGSTGEVIVVGDAVTDPESP